jgi:hypothetical protein
MAPADPIDVDSLVLARGEHVSPAVGMCVMEAVAYLAGEPFTDMPECASPVLGEFLRSWNDALDDTTRQTLKPYIPRLVGSRGTAEQEDARAWLAFDWLVRTYTPVWLRLAGLDVAAATLAALPEFEAGRDDPVSTMDAARRAAAAAGDAAWAAAWAAAEDVAGDAAWAAARAAARADARDAAGAAAWAAAWDAARAAARDAARDAAWAAAEAAAWDAAWAAARDVAGDAAGAAARAAGRAAGRAAATDVLRPAVVELQASAHHLIDRMLAITEETQP